MSAFGWITTGHRLPVASSHRRRTPRHPKARVSIPAVETLETIDLLSTMAHSIIVPHVAPKTPVHLATHAVKAPAAASTAPAEVLAFSSKTVTKNASPMAVTQTTQLQTATVADTLTNFSLPFTPPIALFDPTLGQLVSVTVSAKASLTSRIVSENTSITSGADITGFTNGNFTITGLGTPLTGSLNGTTQTVTVPAFPGGVPNFTGPSTANFPDLAVTNSQGPTTFNSPAQLAFFTASAGRTSISPVLTDVAQSGASAPNGNLITLVRTSGSGVITVTYNYIAQCPAVTKLVRFGIHHQPTQIQLTFAGPLNPTQASNPAFYTIIAPNAQGSFTGPGTTRIAVTSAIYNPANNTVTLTTAKQLNVHHLFQLSINLPCSNGNPTIIEFGSKFSLGGFSNHDGTFVPVIGGVAQYPNGPGPLPNGRGGH